MARAAAVVHQRLQQRHLPLQRPRTTTLGTSIGQEGQRQLQQQQQQQQQHDGPGACGLPGSRRLESRRTSALSKGAQEKIAPGADLRRFGDVNTRRPVAMPEALRDYEGDGLFLTHLQVDALARVAGTREGVLEEPLYINNARIATSGLFRWQVHFRGDGSVEQPLQPLPRSLAAELLTAV